MICSILIWSMAAQDVYQRQFHGCSRLKVLEIRHNPEYIGEWIINRAARIRCYQGSKVDKYCLLYTSHLDRTGYITLIPCKVWIGRMCVIKR